MTLLRSATGLDSFSGFTWLVGCAPPVLSSNESGYSKPKKESWNVAEMCKENKKNHWRAFKYEESTGKQIFDDVSTTKTTPLLIVCCRSPTLSTLEDLVQTAIPWHTFRQIYTPTFSVHAPQVQRPCILLLVSFVRASVSSRSGSL